MVRRAKDTSVRCSSDTFAAMLLRIKQGQISNNSDIDTLTSKRLSVENKGKLSQLTRADFVIVGKVAY